MGSPHTPRKKRQRQEENQCHSVLEAQERKEPLEMPIPRWAEGKRVLCLVEHSGHCSRKSCSHTWCWAQVKGQGEDLEPRSPISSLQGVVVKESREMGPGLEINVRGRKHVKMGNMASSL